MTVWSAIWSDKSLTRAQRQQAVLAAADPARPAFVRPAVRGFQRPIVAVKPMLDLTGMVAEEDINRATAQATARMEAIKAKKPIEGTLKISKYQRKQEKQRLAAKAAH